MDAIKEIHGSLERDGRRQSGTKLNLDGARSALYVCLNSRVVLPFSLVTRKYVN